MPGAVRPFPCYLYVNISLNKGSEEYCSYFVFYLLGGSLPSKKVLHSSAFIESSFLATMTGSSKNQDKFEATMNQLLANQRIFQEEMSNHMTNLEAQVLSRHNNEPKSSNNKILPFSRTTVKLDIPHFDGSNPLGWIFQITQYFDLHNIPEEQRLQIASFSMDGEALNWFQWMHANNQLTSWATFIHCLEIRFAPSHYEDLKGALFKLCQTTTVREYQAQFESLANRIVGLPPPFFLSCFVSGLKPEIRREVQAFQPISLSQAISLAKLQEDKFADIATSIRSQHFTPIAQRSLVNTDFPSSKPVSIPNSSFPPKSSPNINNPPIKRLSAAELQNRREKGLCYYCCRNRNRDGKANRKEKRL